MYKEMLAMMNCTQPWKTRAIHTITRMSPSPRIATIHQLKLVMSA